jgi:hypothetical protein
VRRERVHFVYIGLGKKITYKFVSGRRICRWVGRSRGSDWAPAAPCSPLAPRVNNKLKFRDEFSKRYLRYIKKEKKDDGSAFLFSFFSLSSCGALESLVAARGSQMRAREQSFIIIFSLTRL